MRANGQEAELEVSPESFDTYEGLRSLVVDALPDMFDDSDELVLDYLGRRGKWERVRSKTPVDTIKASGTIKMSCRGPKKRSHPK